MSTQIKVTPEQLEQAAKTIRNTKSSLEYIHRDLYSQTEYIASQWSGASSDRFYQMFNEAKPMMFNIMQELDKIAVELERAAVKFREADELYGGNLIDSDIQEGAMCGKLPPKSEESFFNAKDLNAAWTGISTGFIDGAVDAWEGLISLGDKETWLNMRDAIVNYEETVPAALNALSDSFVNNLWHGDMESREHYVAYGVATLGLGLLGDKGPGQVGKVAAITGMSKGKSLVINSPVYRNALHILNNYEFKAGNYLSYAWVGSTQQYLQKAATYTYEGANGPKTIRLRKGDLAGDKHPVTGIPYDAEGFPIFESKGEIMFKKSRTIQSRKCSKALYEQIMENPELALKFTDEEIQLFKIGKTPEHYTWHHHQDTGRMQLVDYQTHHDTGHTGGYKIWGKDSDK
ncbi:MULTISPECIES: WXG100 family type VII secretion target [Bacillus cereus group]|uniref:WXG100 family type VII secretion target n=1 Tax=Bacillus cereus group TaxID=86661 RepID=UPI001298D323|nr:MULTISPECIES: WXG100 family type VII secretion target [Bacillus cereus group]MCR6789948.1 WXG100 family type VII secretion target [Bacillus thuringiensis]MCR6825928.1 WXG100 family type VII secretion target [Bacillus thuringiensis]MCR6831780.1 WXG100 family type VII secretion target [Bacillus thuringiensis]MEB9327338.1 WXG100 family type VII secretion target [Bacillus cereus]MEB9915226.1 WXG100 family type VII secretion target [Bacillus cereus]